jgi:hypothetical protein
VATSIKPAVLGRLLEDGIRGVAQGLFPTNGFGAPDWEATEIVPRTLSYLAEMPSLQRRMLMLMFGAVELGAPLLVPGFRRFSRLPPERRARAVRRWRSSPIFLFRLLGDGLKASMTMMYMSHPSVLAYTGQFTSCENPDDPCSVEVRSVTVGLEEP